MSLRNIARYILAGLLQLVTLPLFGIAVTADDASNVPLVGLGISLGTSYGMAAVQVAGKQPVPVARKIGTHAYRELMRLEPQDTPRTGNQLAKDIHVAYAMLMSLKTSAEQYIGHELCVASVSLHDPDAAGGSMEKIVTAAMTRARLVSAQMLPRFSPNGAMAVYSQGKSKGELPNGTTVILEASFDGLNFDMIFKATDTLFVRRLLNVRTSNFLESVYSMDTIPKTSAWKRHDLVLKGIATIWNPIRDPELSHGHEIPSSHRLDNLVVFGDATGDRSLHSALMYRFGKNITNHCVLADPLHAPALGAARLALDQMAYIGTLQEHEMCTHLGKGRAFWTEDEFIHQKIEGDIFKHYKRVQRDIEMIDHDDL